MNDITNYIQTNWAVILAGLTGFMAFVTAVVRLTPTAKDDAVWDKICIYIKKAIELFTKKSV